MRRLIPLLCSALLVLAAADCGGDARAESPPKPKAAERVALTVAGDTLTATWGYKAPGLFATDTALLTWSQKPTGGAWVQVGVVQKTRASSASKPIPQVAVGDSVRLCIQVARVGAPPSPIVCGVKGRPPVASPGADSITLAQVIIRSVPFPAVAKAMLAGQAIPGDSNRVQFCAFGVLSDGRRVKLQNSMNIPLCETAYQSWLAERSA